MRRTQLFSLSVLAACITSSAALAEEMPAVPETPAAVTAIVSAQPFELANATTHLWRAEQPSYTTGLLLVLKVDPALVVPRQTAEPVLYVNHQTAERVNHGFESGHVIAIVPGVLDDPEHPDYLNPDRLRVWFGTPELPERVDATMIKQEVSLAKRSGIRPLKAPRSAAVSTVSANDKSALYAEASKLIAKYSPQEAELVRTLSGQAK